MKRGAGKQGGRDDLSDDDVEEISDTHGFKKADVHVLASRPMKGIPKRGSSAANSPLNSPSPLPAVSDVFAGSEDKPKLEGFRGFGAPPSPTPFTFTPKSIVTPPSAQSQSNIAASVLASSSSSPSGFAGIAPVASSASWATKTFASFVNSSSSPSTTHTSSSASVSGNDGGANDNAALKFYTALRGLNASFVTAVSNAVELDPFLDVAEMMERYQSLRVTMQREFDGPKASASDNAKVKPNFSPANTTTDLGRPPPPQPAVPMPVPPQSFAGFPPITSASTSSPSFSVGGFKPKLDSSSSSTNSGFSFATPPESSSAKSFPATQSPFLSSGSVSNSTKSIFGAVDDDPKPASAFGSSSTASPFGLSSSFGKTPSAFSGSIFGPPKSSQSDKNTTASPSSSSSVFGTSNNTPPSNGASSSPSPGVLNFGSFNPSGSPGGFGSKGSIGNPVGFSFGSPTPEPETPSASAATGFSFFSKPSESNNDSQTKVEDSSERSSAVFAIPESDAASATPAAPKGFSFPAGPSGGGGSLAQKALSPPNSEDSRGATPADGEGDESQKLLGPNPHDEEGEGEEDEETTHSSRLKVYKLKQSNGKPEWADMGVGMLRLKRHKSTQARRMLLRNSGNGKIVINFSLYPALKPTRVKHFVSFIGHDSGKMATFKLRLRDEAQAIELKSALDREIAVVKAKEDTS